MTTANLVKTIWLARYPWGTKVPYKRVSKFLGPEFIITLFRVNIELNQNDKH